ncbi:GUN4-like protein [[Synechococcus] sp. NIES-970]|uniref:GUN4 domain-containing protein n=1 Tax=Picosynechococcus sp. NKBG15041c TaxID=1407650 RepID=UPI0004220E0B|nr:GUN4 domain-containing protein [Picosynechococcus sp. NKBG15041c]BAW96952.1 GUN4-like protein [[Synechococcus] sp. NIES-970]
MEATSDLLQEFSALSAKKQLERIPQLIDEGDTGFALLRDFLLAQQDQEATPVMGRICQVLTQNQTADNLLFMQREFPEGVVELQSARNIDYQIIQDKLIEEEFLEADLLTIQKMCELAGESAMKRKWLYFTEVERFPAEDLLTLDRLWQVYSGGKFGFSVQRKLWNSLDKDFNALWEKIAWRDGRTFARYPKAFIWDLEKAPLGHLPTTNQLRGSKMITALFLHPAWTKA